MQPSKGATAGANDVDHLLSATSRKSLKNRASQPTSDGVLAKHIWQLHCLAASLLPLLATVSQASAKQRGQGFGLPAAVAAKLRFSDNISCVLLGMDTF
jgi:hypothetical protein